MRRSLLLPILLLAACQPGENASAKGCQSMSATDDIPVTSTVDTTELRRTVTGLGIQDLRVGNGATAEPGRMVAVHYTGWLTDGTEFDSSRRPSRAGGSPEVLTFALGRGQVIEGWEEGITGMKVGGRRKLVIPPALGYGDAGNGPIPGGASLVFDVELCRVQ